MKSDAEIQVIVDDAVERFSGRGDVLVGAIGTLMLGRYYGWRVMRLMTGHRDWARYRRLLGVDLKECMPERGLYASRSLGLRMVDQVGNYWDTVRGMASVTMEERRQIASGN